MGKYQKKKSAKKRNKTLAMLLGCLAVVAAATLILVLLAFGKSGDLPETQPQGTQEQIPQTQSTEDVQSEPTQTEAPQVRILQSVEEEGNVMAVTTSYCVLRFPFAFSDLIHVNEECLDEQNSLVFCVCLNGTEYPMFSVIFNGTGAIPVGTLRLADGTELSVTAELFEPVDEMDSGMVQTFYAAQETINEVLNSLTDAEGFTPAQ